MDVSCAITSQIQDIHEQLDYMNISTYVNLGLASILRNSTKYMAKTRDGGIGEYGI